MSSARWCARRGSRPWSSSTTWTSSSSTRIASWSCTKGSSSRAAPPRRSGRTRRSKMQCSGPAMLEVRGIDSHRGRAQVLRQVSLWVGEQEAVCLVGRNGAGKTTTIDSIIGLLPLRAGRITFQGRDIGALPPYRRARLGIGYAPEDAGLFPDLTVAENLQICRWLAQSSGRANQVEQTDQRVDAIFPEIRALAQRRGLYLS